MPEIIVVNEISKSILSIVERYKEKWLKGLLTIPNLHPCTFSWSIYSDVSYLRADVLHVMHDACLEARMLMVFLNKM